MVDHAHHTPQNKHSANNLNNAFDYHVEWEWISAFCAHELNLSRKSSFFP